MKISNKKKPRGIKHKIREEKKKEHRIGLTVTIVILIVIISVCGFFIQSMLSPSPREQETNSTSEHRAAIVDHLSLTYPNQTFIETATNILKQAGYTVDYYPSEEVTVEFYRNLPTHSYSLIILRVHSSARGLQNEKPAELPVVLFTSELYSTTKYIYEQLTDQTFRAAYTIDSPDYFAIAPKFVTRTMNGNFQNTTIIMMGCDGLMNTEMAKAFIEKGARVYISWNGSVLASHTDRSTIQLLQHFLIEKRTIKESVQETFKEVGADPAYNSQLLYYPIEAGDYTIQNFISNTITNNTKRTNMNHHREEEVYSFQK